MNQELYPHISTMGRNTRCKVQYHTKTSPTFLSGRADGTRGNDIIAAFAFHLGTKNELTALQFVYARLYVLFPSIP